MNNRITACRELLLLLLYKAFEVIDALFRCFSGLVNACGDRMTYCILIYGCKPGC